MEKKVPTTNTEPKALPNWMEDLERDLDNDSLADIFDEDMTALLSQNSIRNSPKKTESKKVQPKRGAKQQTELLKPAQPTKGKGKKGAKGGEPIARVPMEVTASNEETQSLLAQASKDLIEEENDLQEREKKLRTAGVYDKYEGLAHSNEILDDLATKLERELTINFFKTEFITNVDFKERAEAYDFTNVLSIELNGEEMIVFLKSGTLKNSVIYCDTKELSMLIDWILMTVCSHDEIGILDRAFSLLDHILSLKRKELVIDFASLNFEKIAHDSFGYDVQTSNSDILCESGSSKRKYDEFKSLEGEQRQEGLHWEGINSIYSKKQTSLRPGALRSRSKPHVSTDPLAEPKKEYEILLHAKTKSSSSNSSLDQNMDVEGEEGGMSLEGRTQEDKEVKSTQDESMAFSLELPEFPLVNFYYFIKSLRSCVENCVFKFDDDNLLKLLQFCYASILSVKHLGNERDHLFKEIQDLILAIWKNVHDVNSITTLCRRLVSSYSSYLIDFRYAIYCELVTKSPHYFLSQECPFSVRNYLSVLILKTTVIQKVDFDSARPEERIDISHGMLSLFKEVTATMKTVLKYISPETNITHKKCTEYDWQECISVLLANSLTFPQLPKTGETVKVEDSTKAIMAEMREIVRMIQKWESLLNDAGFKEMQAKTKIFLLKIDYENFLKELDEFIENPTASQLKNQNKQPTIDGFFKK
jgi:hypothetical protein